MSICTNLSQSSSLGMKLLSLTLINKIVLTIENKSMEEKGSLPLLLWVWESLTFAGCV